MLTYICVLLIDMCEEFHIARVKQYGNTLNCLDICEFVAGIFGDSNDPSVSVTVGNFLIM